MKREGNIPMGANVPKGTSGDVHIQEFLDMIAPQSSGLKQNTFRCVWALREYPTSTDEQAILSHLGEKGALLSALGKLTTEYEKIGGNLNQIACCLKLKADWFSDKRIKKLRSIAGGDMHTIIYLKMMLFSLKDEGKLYFEGVEEYSYTKDGKEIKGWQYKVKLEFPQKEK